MRKLLIILIVLLGAIQAVSQSQYTNWWIVKADSTPFVRALPNQTIVALIDSNKFYRLTRAVSSYSSMADVFTSGYYMEMPSLPGTSGFLEWSDTARSNYISTYYYVDSLVGTVSVVETDPIWSLDSAYVLHFKDTLDTWDKTIGTIYDIDTLSTSVYDSLEDKLSNIVRGSVVNADSVAYYNRTTGKMEMRFFPANIISDSLAWVYDPINNSVYLRHINDSVGVHTSTPNTEFTIVGNVNYTPVVYDSADIDGSGITVDLMSRVIIYDDTDDAWYDWTYGGGAQFEAGQEGQLITIFSVGSGTLFLRNNTEAGDTVVAFNMFGGDNITIKYADATWIEVARTDFDPASLTTPGGGIGAGSVTYVGATGNTGISVTGSPITSAGTFDITNTAPDQTVTINAGTGISVASAYPVFTVSSSFASTLDSAKIWIGSTAGVPVQNYLSTDMKLNSSGVATIQPNAVTTTKIINNAVTGAKIAMGSDAQGDILYYNGTDYIRLPAGTNGYFLKTQGGGANPIWSSTGAGAGSVTNVSGVPANGFTWSITNPTTTPAITLTLQDAVADGATKGQATYRALDFNSSSGVIWLDYINGQKATTSLNGFMDTDLYDTVVTAYNNMIISAGFDITTGILTHNQQDGGTITVDLDGRYMPTAYPSQGVVQSSGSAWETSATGVENYLAKWDNQYTLDTSIIYNVGDYVMIDTVSPLAIFTVNTDYTKSIFGILAYVPNTAGDATVAIYGSNKDESSGTGVKGETYAQAGVGVHGLGNNGGYGGYFESDTAIALKAVGEILFVLPTPSTGFDSIYVKDRGTSRVRTAAATLVISIDSTYIRSGKGIVLDSADGNTYTVINSAIDSTTAGYRIALDGFDIDNVSYWNLQDTIKNNLATGAASDSILVKTTAGLLKKVWNNSTAWNTGLQWSDTIGKLATDYDVDTLSASVYDSLTNKMSDIVRPLAGSPDSVMYWNRTLNKAVMKVMPGAGAETDPIYAGDSAKIVWFMDTLSTGKIATKKMVWDTAAVKMSNVVRPVAGSPDSIMYWDRTLSKAVMKVLPGAGGETDPVWAADSANVVHFKDTLASWAKTIGTDYDVDTLSLSIYDSLTNIYTDGQTDALLALRVLIADSNKTSTGNYVTRKYGDANYIQSGFLIWSDTTGKISTDYDVDTLSLSVYDSLVDHLDTLQAHNTRINSKEPLLGNPSVSAYVLASTTGGVRSWIAQSSAMTYPDVGIAKSTGSAWTTSLVDSSVWWGIAYDTAAAAGWITKWVIDAEGDLVYGTANNAFNNLAIGAAGTFLRSRSGIPAWDTIKDASGTSRGLLTSTNWTTFNNKMNNPLTTTGDIIYSSSGTTPGRLGIGANNYILTSNGSIPEWVAPAATHAAVTIGTPANGLSLSTQQVSLGLATAADTGALSSWDWKRLDSAYQYMVFSASGDGVLTLSLTDNVLSGEIDTASTSSTGILTDTDWNIFNGKGTVSSITVSAPLATTQAPITTTATLSITQSGVATDGYLSSTEWGYFDDAYDNTIESAAFSTANGNYTLTQRDAGTIITNFDGRYFTGTAVDGYLSVGASSTSLDSTTLYWTGTRLGILNASPSYTLDVTGDIKSSSRLRVEGTTHLTGLTAGSTATHLLTRNASTGEVIVIPNNTITTDSSMWIHDATLNATRQRYVTDMVVAGGAVARTDINRDMHVVGSQFLGDTLFIDGGGGGGGEIFGYDGGLVSDGYWLFKIGGPVDAADARVQIEGNGTNDTLFIVRNDKIRPLDSTFHISKTGGLFATGLTHQDTATHFVTYNTGTGELKASSLIHGVGSADSIIVGANNYVEVGGTRYVYAKISTAAASSGGFTSHEADGVLIQGDSIKILTAGDYKINIFIAATTTNANDKMRVKLYINNVKSATEIGRFLINSDGTGNQTTSGFIWYKDFAVDDWLSFRVTNITGSRAVRVSDYKILIEKMIE